MLTDFATDFSRALTLLLKPVIANTGVRSIFCSADGDHLIKVETTPSQHAYRYHQPWCNKVSQHWCSPQNTGSQENKTVRVKPVALSHTGTTNFIQMHHIALKLQFAMTVLDG